MDLVKQSDLILAGPLSNQGKDQWKLTVSAVIKGQAAKEAVLDCSSFEKEQLENLRKLLAQSGTDEAVLFASTESPEKAYLHVAGVWLMLKSAGKDRWDVTTFAKRMSGCFAGGSDMLIAMCRYIVADPEASVPTAVGATWAKETSLLGKLAGRPTGVSAVEFKGVY